jgi:hypothetical protein
MMTAKFLVMNAMVTETRQGRIRMAETSGRSVLNLLSEVGGVARRALATRQTGLTIALMALVSIVGVVQSTFWSIVVTERIGIPAGHVAFYPFARSLVMLACLFLIVPRLRGTRSGEPLVWALAAYAASAILLVAVPQKGYALLLVSTVLESAAYSVTATQLECLAVWNVDAHERARIVSIAHVAVLACTTPFGWIAGLLSEVSRALPFVMNAALLGAAIVVVQRLRRITSG